MDSILNALAVYVLLLVLFRLAGRRTLSEMTVFDLVLVLVISEAAQPALVGKDQSFTNSALLILTLLSVDVVLSHIKHRSQKAEKWLDGVPVVLVRHGMPIKQLMDKTRVGLDDVLSAARETQGVPNLNSIAYAILENNGKISVIPSTTGQPNELL